MFVAGYNRIYFTIPCIIILVVASSSSGAGRTRDAGQGTPDRSRPERRRQGHYQCYRPSLSATRYIEDVHSAVTARRGRHGLRSTSSTCTVWRPCICSIRQRHDPNAEARHAVVVHDGDSTARRCGDRPTVARWRQRGAISDKDGKHAPVRHPLSADWGPRATHGRQCIPDWQSGMVAIYVSPFRIKYADASRC